MLGSRFCFEAYAKNVKEKVTKCSLTTTATQTLDVLIFFKRKLCQMSGLKFVLSDVKSFPADNLSGLIKKIYIGACQGPESQVLILHYTAVIVDNNFWYNNKVLAAAETN